MTVGNGDTIRIAPVWSYAGSDQQINVWHAAVSSIPPTLAELHADIDEMLEWLYGTLVNQMSDSLVHVRTEIFNESDGTPEAWMGANSALNGGAAAQALPLGVAALLYARTPISRTIGKKYLPVFTEGDLDAGVWGSTATTRLGEMANRWYVGTVATNGTEFDFRIWKRATSVSVALMSTSYSSIPAYQRRRKQGRGA